MALAGDIQGAIIDRFANVPGLSGAFCDVPARAPYPYLVVNCTDERDCSCKARSGRDMYVEIALWDDQPQRLLTIEGLIDQVGFAAPAIEGWEATSWQLASRKRQRNAAGPWASIMSIRLRLFENSPGGA